MKLEIHEKRKAESVLKELVVAKIQFIPMTISLKDECTDIRKQYQEYCVTLIYLLLPATDNDTGNVSLCRSALIRHC